MLAQVWPPAGPARQWECAHRIHIAAELSWSTLSTIRKDERSLANRDATQVAAGVAYALSKRTSLYAAYGKIHKRNGARYTVGTASERGSGNRALTVGLRHSF